MADREADLMLAVRVLAGGLRETELMIALMEIRNEVRSARSDADIGAMGRLDRIYEIAGAALHQASIGDQKILPRLSRRSRKAASQRNSRSGVAA